MADVDVVPASFLRINREERFFCSLLVHALLSSEALRVNVFRRVSQAAGVDLDPRPGATEIYSEVAWLRDHWRNLGDPKQYSPDLEDKRRQFLDRLLQAIHVDPASVAGQPFLLTGGSAPKVVSPGRWPLKQIAGHEKAQELVQLKWAFNATPDFLFISASGVLLLEAKVESAPGKKVYRVTAADGRARGTAMSFAYSQEETQRTLCRLLPAAAPYLAPASFAWLARDKFQSSSPRLEWSAVAAFVEELPTDDLDDFTRTGLSKFARRAAEGA